MSTQIVMNPTAASVIALVTEAIAKSPTGVSIFSIRNYESGTTNKKCTTTKIANYRINVGINYAKQVQKDIARLEALDVTKLEGFKSSSILLEAARVELIESFKKPNENRSNGQIDAYTTIRSGVKVHNETGILYVYGYKLNEDVIRKGEYLPTNSKPLIIAKDELRYKFCKTAKFVNFGVSVGNVFKCMGREITIGA